MEDKTPKNFELDKQKFLEKIKKPFRKFFYPLLAKIRQPYIEKHFKIKKVIGCDMVFLGQRGNDYEAHRTRVNLYKPIKDSAILIIGIGTGKDLESWLKYNPKEIVGIDYFSYKKAWEKIKEHYSEKFSTKLEFLNIDISNINEIYNENKFDIIGSDAVFEHINKFDDALKSLRMVLKDGGLLYATFGPLYYTWGGDHISGRDGLINGYNHLALTKEQYYRYLDTFGDFNHSEDDGRTWIYNNLFSYLKAKDYLKKLRDFGFKPVYSSCILEKRAIIFQKKYPKKFEVLCSKYGRENLLITGMTIICEKVSDKDNDNYLIQ